MGAQAIVRQGAPYLREAACGPANDGDQLRR